MLDWIAHHPIVTAVIVLVALAVLTALFGAARAWQALATVWETLLKRGGGGGAGVIVACVMLGGCAAIPQTTAAYRTGGLGPAIDVFLAQASARVVTLCELPDQPRIAATVTLTGQTAGIDDRIAAVRAERHTWCAALGGIASIDVQR